jgi:hypothetical protein
MKRLRITLLLLALTAPLITGCAGGPVDRSSDVQTAEAAEKDAATSLRDDIEVFEKTLPRRHKNLFHSIPEEEYRQRLSQLKNQLPGLTESEVEIELRRLLADVGDSHTDLSPRVNRVYPLRFTRFEEGVILRQADKAYADAVGMELTGIDGSPLDEVWKRIAEIVPHENEMQLWNKVPMYLSLPHYLEALDIVGGETTTFELQDSNGKRREFDVQAVPRNSDINWYRYLGDELSTPGDKTEIPLYLDGNGRYYHMAYRDEERLLYIRYGACMEDPEYPFAQFAKDVKKRIQQSPVEKLVVDVRFNGGGDSRVFQPLVDELSEDYREGRAYELFVVIGRGTFSSAIINAVDLKKKAGAVLVGEPTAGKPNHYGEIERIELPHSGLTLSYSTKYFELIEEDVDSLRPDIHVMWSFEDFSSWRDGALEEIRRQ